MSGNPLTAAADPSDRTPTSGGTVTLPPELLAEASRRLGWAALIYAFTYFFAYFGPYVATWLAVPGYPLWRTQHVFAGASIGTAVIVFALSRRAAVGPERFLDLGLAFEVIAAFGISVAEFWAGFQAVDFSRNQFIGIPWECVWIIIFPLVAPNTPRKILIASLASASTGPIVVLMRSVAGVPIGWSPVVVAAFFLFSTYICAIVAYVIARIVYRYNVRLKNARAIGGYELVKKLGEGGMGEVWVARHRMLARPAAVKLIRPDLLGDSPRRREIAVKRFEREAMATAALKSTHTIDLYDFGLTEDGAFFYVMEFLEGMTLDAMIRRFGPVDAARTVYLVKQVCHSLGEAHARGLIHRDVKPANIFTCRLGPDCDFVKVLDFGLVKQTFDSETTPPLTAQGVTAGTPAFMAPELAIGQADIDGRADLYAVGCVAYWLLTGHHVFAADTAIATALAHVRDVPVPPSQRTETAVPPALDAVILDCLAKDRNARPQSASDLVARLDTIEIAAWTPADARRWWALHGPLGTFSAFDGEDLSPAAVVYARR